MITYVMGLPTQVPLKRVNQVYVIATSTKVDIKGVDISKIDDAFFKAAEEPKKKKGEDEFFKADAEEEKKVRRYWERPVCEACCLCTSTWSFVLRVPRSVV